MKKVLFLLIPLIALLHCKKDTRYSQSAEDLDTPTNVEINPTENKTILTIGHINLTNKDFNEYLEFQYPDISEKKKNDRFLSRIFDLFIEQQTVLYHADMENFQVDQEEFENYLKIINLESAYFFTALKRVEDSIKAQKYLYFKLFKSINVSNREIQKYYQDNLNDFRKEQEIQLFQILVKTKEKAIKIRNELINNPGRFEQLARKESISPEAKQNGRMGYYEKGILPKEMEDVVFSLKRYEISPIVESPFGYHIFKVTRRRQRRLLFFNNVKNDIKNRLYSKKLSSAYNDFLSQLKNETPLIIYKDNLFFTYIDEQKELEK